MMYEDYDPERDRQDVGHLIVGFIIGLWALFLMTMCSSCTTTKYVQVPEYHTDTLIQTKVLKDSVWLHDSTFIREKGDTVLIERWHTQYKWRELHDTIYQSKTDSIPYHVEVTKEVPAQLTWWQQARMHVGGIVIYGILIILTIKLYRKYAKP